MEIKILKNEAIFLKGKSVNLILDPSGEGLKELEIAGAVFSRRPGEGESRDAGLDFRVSICGPGEYEIGGAQILGVTDEERINYKIKMDGLKIAFITAKIKDKDEEFFGDVDCLILAQNFPELVLKLEPKIVVVYKTDEALKFLKDIGRENTVPTSRLVIKREALPGELEAVWFKI